MKWVLMLFSFGAVWLILLAGAASSLVSCGPSKEEIEAREKQKEDSTQKAQQAWMAENHSEPTSPVVSPPKMYNNNADFYIGIYSINGCEYLSFGQGKGCCAVVHAGNCINPIHYTTTHTVVERDDGRPY